MKLDAEIKIIIKGGNPDSHFWQSIAGGQLETSISGEIDTDNITRTKINAFVDRIKDKVIREFSGHLGRNL